MNRLKIVLFIALSSLVMTFAFGTQDCVFAAANDISVYVDGTEVNFPDAKPYISNSRTLVPIRFISEQLGASVSWDNDTKTVAINKNHDSIKLAIGSRQVVKNGVLSTIDVAPAITNDRTMVPLRFVSEQLGVDVEWDAAKRSVLISAGETYTTYIVKAGDTLWHIASVSGMSIDELQTINPDLNPDKLMAGQQLNLLATSKMQEASTSTAASETKESITSSEKIGFGTTYERTSSLCRGESKVITAGVYGMREVTSEVTKAEDRTISTKVIKTEVVLEPKNQVLSVGTKTPSISRESKSVSVEGSADEIVAYAQEYLGVPYIYGGSTPDGFDCSGFTQYVITHFGGYLPHSAAEQYNYGISVEKEDLQPGDLVFFEESSDPLHIGHVGIYIGDGEFINAPKPGENVKISSLSDSYFDQRFYGAVRVTNASTTTATAQSSN